MCDDHNSIIAGRWRMVQYSHPFTGNSGFCKEHIVWDFVPSVYSKWSGRLFVYKGGKLNGEYLPYSCTESSITFCDKLIYAGEDDFEWRVRIYHYRMLEGLSLQLRQYDIQNADNCRTIGWADCVVKCSEVLLFEPYETEGEPGPVEALPVP